MEFRPAHYEVDAVTRPTRPFKELKILLYWRERKIKNLLCFHTMLFF